MVHRPTRQRPIRGKGGEILFKEITDIDAVLANSRQRGLYKEAGEEFLASEKNGVEIDLENGQFKGKSVDTVYQGFNTASKVNNWDNLRVIKAGESVYLVNTELT